MGERRLREGKGEREKQRGEARAFKARVLSLARGTGGQRASGGLCTDIATTMGPFVLCSAFLITPARGLHGDGHPAEPFEIAEGP